MRNVWNRGKNIRPSSKFSANFTCPISPPHSESRSPIYLHPVSENTPEKSVPYPTLQHSIPAQSVRIRRRHQPAMRRRGAYDATRSWGTCIGPAVPRGNRLFSLYVSDRAESRGDAGRTRGRGGGRELISTEQRPARHVETAILAAADVASSPLENSAENSARQTSDRRQGTNEFMLCARACYSQERCDVDRYMRSHDTNFGCTAFVLGCVKPMTTLCVKKPVRHFRSD